MLDLYLLSAALCLESPWSLKSAEACLATRRLHLGLACPQGSLFGCPTCGANCPPELDAPRVWCHPDFFGYRTYLLTRMPDLGCQSCGIVAARAGWERLGFALLVCCPARPGLAEWCAAGPILALDPVAAERANEQGTIETPRPFTTFRN